MQLFTLLGGLGLFLYGMQLLSGALTALAAGRQTGLAGGAGLPGGQAVYTAGSARSLGAQKGPANGAGLPGRQADTAGLPGQRALPSRRPASLRCFFAQVARGAGITAVVQSSSAVTMFALSAADAGVLSAMEAIGLCWGANLGTTITGHLLALSRAGGLFARLLPAVLCPLCCFLGSLAQLVSKGRAALWGQALLGFGLLFTGLDGVQSGILPLLTGGRLYDFLHAAQSSYPAALLAGTLLAAALQSSSVALGLLQTIALSGQLCWEAALPLVLGVNIGTCSTALAACLGAAHDRRAARQVALGHLCFNLVGSGAASLLHVVLHDAAFWHAPAGFVSLAWLQTAFNVATLAFFLLLIAALALLRPDALCMAGSTLGARPGPQKVRRHG